MNKRKFFLILIFALAFFLRHFKIAEFPKTLYGDEQAFAWNAYSILKTGTDEYGVPYPLQFRSFNDYKAPIPVYLLVPFFKIFGMNIWSIRIPVVIASLLTVILFYFFIRLFLVEKISLIAVFLFAISPWHIHLSRGYFEATISLLFFIAGIYFFFKSRLDLKKILYSSLFFALSLYSYFTPRLLLPIFIPFLLYSGIRFFTKNKKHDFYKSYFALLAAIFLLSIPLLYATFLGKGLSRFNKLNENMNRVIIETVNRERNASNLPQSMRVAFHNKATVWLRLVKNNYLEHLSADFWFIYGDNSLRYFLGNMGMFYLFEMPLLIIGIFYIFKKNNKLGVFLIGWLLLAPIPASLVGRSFAVRSLALLPAPFVFSASGIFVILNFVKKNLLSKIFLILFPLIVAVSLGGVLIKYYLEYPVYAATWWGWENKAALDYAGAREHLYDHIFISDYYTGIILAYAVYNKYDPAEYRNSINNPVVIADGRRFIKLGKYYFGSLDLDSQRLSQNIIPEKSLYIGRPEEADSKETINAPDDGRTIFKIYNTN